MQHKIRPLHSRTVPGRAGGGGGGGAGGDPRPPAKTGRIDRSTLHAKR
jgi:hypothetical protein